MANTLTDRLEELDLSELNTRARQELEIRKQAVEQRAGRALRQARRRREQLVGQLQDQSLTRLYGAAEGALSKVHGLLERAPGMGIVNARLEALSGEVSARLEAIEHPPIADYDELNVKKINAQLEGCDAHTLSKVRDYEERNKNRVTILREIDRLLEI